MIGNHKKFYNDCVVNGTTYYTGTVFQTKHWGDAVFVCRYCDGHGNDYMLCKMKGDNWHIPMVMFGPKYFAGVNSVACKDVKMPENRYMRDCDVQSVYYGWMWYIALMLFGIIVKEALVWWITITIVFFVWRHFKMKEEGSYIEW